ncbi:MAG: DUF1704 domain-containing protein [Candidatus Riflebacteria bacterium]|nr:DUF1704 domain-containing protein [Candidatus Riflebacteria bacterium]
MIRTFLGSFFNKLFILSFVFIFSSSVSNADPLPTPTFSEKFLDSIISEVSKSLQFSNLINPTPESAAAEKAKFFEAKARGESYDPQFQYLPLPAGIDEKIHELVEAPAPTGAYSNLLNETRQELLLKYQLLKARGTPEFSALSKQLVPLPENSLLEQAQNVLKNYPLADEPLDVSPAQMKLELQKGLKEFGLNEWKVVFSRNMSARASVLPMSKEVKINPDAKFSTQDITRMVQHEVGVHAVRASYGTEMPLKIFNSGVSDYLTTEEGAAAYNETQHNVFSGLNLFAKRALAGDWASQMPFSQVFSKLKGLGVDDEMAYSIAQRAKRGLTDTNQPGGFTKDVCYLRGYLKVKNFLEQNGKWEDLLHYGKTKVSDIENLKKYDAPMNLVAEKEQLAKASADSVGDETSLPVAPKEQLAKASADSAGDETSLAVAPKEQKARTPSDAEGDKTPFPVSSKLSQVKSFASQGWNSAKDTLNSQLSVKSIGLSVGMAVGTELVRQVASGEKISLAKAEKVVASAEFLGGIAGSVVGAAAGAGVAPLLRGIPYVGGFLAALAPVIGGTAGYAFGATTSGDAKNGAFFGTALKDGFRKMDWVSVTGQSVGSLLGSVVGSFFGPVGAVAVGIAGGYVGDLVARKIASFCSSDQKDYIYPESVISTDTINDANASFSFQLPSAIEGSPGSRIRVRVKSLSRNPFADTP